MFETISIKSNFCDTHKKTRFGRVNKVAFELFVEVIFIPRYTKQHCSELWWNSSELNLSAISAQNEFITLVKKYPMMTLEQAKHVLYC